MYDFVGISFFRSHEHIDCQRAAAIKRPFSLAKMINFLFRSGQLRFDLQYRPEESSMIIIAFLLHLHCAFLPNAV